MAVVETALKHRGDLDDIRRHRLLLVDVLGFRHFHNGVESGGNRILSDIVNVGKDLHQFIDVKIFTKHPSGINEILTPGRNTTKAGLKNSTTTGSSQP